MQCRDATIQYKYKYKYNAIHTIHYNAIRYTTIRIHIDIEYRNPQTGTIPILYNTIHTINNTRGSGSRKDSLRDHPRTLMQGRSMGG